MIHRKLYLDRYREKKRKGDELQLSVFSGPENASAEH
jgi:hypothetical protein